jgi:3-oxoadipate enol-lactonase
MPFLEANGARFHYLWDGPESAPVLVFSNSLGTNLAMWDPQIPALASRFRILRYDTRGHGQSESTPGPYSITQLGRDVVAFLDLLGIDRAHFCGLSMGGATGLWLGIYAADRIHRLILSSTAAKFGTPEIWKTRIDTVRSSGMAPVANTQAGRWFTPEFIAHAPEKVEWTRQMILHSPPEGYIANCAAVRDTDFRETASRIRNATLIIVGAADPVTPPSEARFLEQRIPGSRCTEIHGSHLCNVESPDAFTSALSNFLIAA